MANPEHLEIVKQGANVIKAWRESNPDLRLDLRGGDLRDADLREAYLYEAYLYEAYLYEAKLNEADLSDTCLSEAILFKTELSNANLRKANLSEAKLRYTDLSSAHLSGADLNRASSVGTLWVDLDLSQVVGLETIKHLGRSSLGVDTLMNSKGQIPEVFLRSCGLSDDFISYIPSHFANSAIDFYSCFISYSHEDKSFARRLYDGLQGKGIRCWLDDHQILPGDDIYHMVDRGIRVSDKILLCASENSLTSGWVDHEIDHTFAKELELFKSNKKQVLSLIPLNLDDYLLERWDHPKKNLILKRLAADFVGWEFDNNKFEEQFERIVKALKPNNAGREPDPIPKLK